MIWSLLITVSLALSWTLSPDALVLIGNSAGQNGLNFFAALLGGVFVSIWGIAVLHHSSFGISQTTQTIRIIETIGSKPAVTLVIASRVPIVILLPTGMLVTAGFTFNETFLYWFPNFGFSFLLLGVVLSIHLIGERCARSVQPLFIGAAVISLLTLSLFGLSSPETQTLKVASNSFTSTITGFSIAPLLFLGYDHITPATSGEKKHFYWIAVVSGFVLVSLWALASLFHVNPAILSSSTVPYIISAREIMGQPGRILIGITIIAGACGAVNGFFLLANSSLIQLTEEICSQKIQMTGWTKRIYPAIFTLAISVCMATGLAGSEDLEVYIYGALILWLVSLGAHCYAATRALQAHAAASVWHGYLLSTIFPLCALSLAVAHNNSGQIFSFCFLILAISALFSILLDYFFRKIRASIN